MPVPETGTFRIYPFTISTKWGEFGINPGSGGAGACVIPTQFTNEEVEAILNSGIAPTSNEPSSWASEDVYCPAPDDNCYGSFPLPRDYGLMLSTDSSRILFNPSSSSLPLGTFVDFLSSDFPMGFLATSLRLHYFGAAKKSSANNCIVDFNLLFNDAPVYTDAIPNLSANASVASAISSATAIVGLGNYVGILQCLAHIGFKYTCEANQPVVAACDTFDTVQVDTQLLRFFLSGSYILWSNSLTSTPATDELVQPNSIITINDGNDKLDQITQFQVTYVNENDQLVTFVIPPANVLEQDESHVTIILPLGIPFGGQPITITGTGDGTEFTGEVPLAQFNTELADHSGVYFLSEDRTSDKMYDRTVSPVTTIDVKIPRPFIRTGFFRG